MSPQHIQRSETQYLMPKVVHTEVRITFSTVLRRFCPVYLTSPCIISLKYTHFFYFALKCIFLFHLVFYFFPKECFKIIPNTATFPFIWRKALPKHYLSYLSELSPLVVSHIVMSPWFQNMIQTGHGSPRVLTTSSSPQTPHIHGRKRQTEVVIDPDYATYS